MRNPTMTPRPRFLLVLPFLAALAPPAGAETADHAARYRNCMALAASAPQAAFDDALAWADLGGGEAARHCQAAALLGLGQHAEAARRLETLADQVKAGPGFKAELLAQAAQGWLLAGDGARAEATLAEALRLEPDNPDLLTDRAAARAALGRYQEAVDDLTRVLAADPRRIDALVFRASAQRFLERPEAAEVDVETALALDPDHAEGLLERGNLRRLRGDDAGARRDWLRAATVAPGSPAALAAQANLERMDVQPR
jgi:tetratricopeptide (TPR) repeat protein